MKSILITLTVFFLCISNLQANGNGKGGGQKDPAEPFVDGFNDSLTPGVLCPWEQLNPCENRREIFVMSETKKANGENYYYDYDKAQLEHIDVCMREKDAPTGLVIYGLFSQPVDLDNDNGCLSPCDLLLRPDYVNRLSCHENAMLDQSQGILNDYSIDTLRAYTRPSDNYFCHEDYLPPNVTPDECLSSTSRYCFRDLQAGETGYEFEDYLAECLNTYWIE